MREDRQIAETSREEVWAVARAEETGHVTRSRERPVREDKRRKLRVVVELDQFIV